MNDQKTVHTNTMQVHETEEYKTEHELRQLEAAHHYHGKRLLDELLRSHNYLVKTNGAALPIVSAESIHPKN